MIGKPTRITAADLILLAGVGAAAVWLLHQAALHAQYRWNWQAIPQYLLRFDATAGKWVPGLILQGVLVTLRLSRPPKSGVYPVPPTALYDNKRIYLLRDGRLAGVEVEILGTSKLEGGSYRLVRSDGIADGEQLVLTRLPNATTGLKVEPVTGAPGPDKPGDKKRLAAQKTEAKE